jgi:hypothetical protein
MTDMALPDEEVAVQLVSFLPIGESGPSRSVDLLLPQCELRNNFESFTIDNLPVSKRDWLGRDCRHWIVTACKLADIDRCPITIICDTQGLADFAAKTAGPLLRKHRQVTRCAELNQAFADADNCLDQRGE